MICKIAPSIGVVGTNTKKSKLAENLHFAYHYENLVKQLTLEQVALFDYQIN